MDGLAYLNRGNNFLKDNNIKEACLDWRKASESGIKEAYQKLWQYSPATYDFDKSPQEAKSKVINGVRGLLDRLPAESTFENLIQHIILVQGRETADNIFKAIQYGWENCGNEPTDYCEVYWKVFSSLNDDQKSSSVSQISNTQKEVNILTLQISEADKPVSKFKQYIDKHKDDLLKAYVYSLFISCLLGSVIRYIINPAIPTWVIYLSVFIGSLIFIKRYEQ